MIVQPDFLDHWKTRMLVNVTNDPTAPFLLLRLWAHCQQRKTHRFEHLSDSALAAICKTTLKSAELKKVLIDCGFIKEKGSCVVVHDWDVINSSLVASWKNGQKGGRPSHGIPRNNPRDTQTEPSPLSSLSSLSSHKNSTKRAEKGRCSQQEAEDYCVSIGLPRSDGKAMYLHWQEKGWAKVKDWKLTIQKWQSFGYLPSQKKSGGQSHQPMENKI